MGKQRSKQPEPRKPQPQPKHSEPFSAEITPDFADPGAFLSPNLDPNLQRRAILNYGRKHGNKRVLQLLSDNPQARNVIARETPVATDGTMAEIRKINSYRWIAPWDESRLQQLWNSYGSHLPEVAAANWGEFQKSQAGGAELEDIEAVKSTRQNFERDVKGLANQYLAQNEKTLLEEMAKVGVSPTMCQGITEEMQQEMAQMQKVAKQIQALLDVQTQLRQLFVGYYDHTYNDPFEGDVNITLEMRYNPDRPPMRPPNGSEDPAFAPYDAVDKSYKEIQGAIDTFVEANPAMYPLLQSCDIGKLAQETEFVKAQALISKSLGTVYDNVVATKPKIDSGDLDWRDLKPLHAQLYAGKKGESNTDWSNTFAQWAAKAVISGHESAEFWLSLGLGSLAAAAFIFSTIASGGWFAVAVAVGVGAGGVQAGMSWEKYLDYAQAAKTNLSDQTQLVSDGQVNAALLGAIMDTAFSLLDIYGVGKVGVTALRGGRLIAEAGEAGLKKAAVEGLQNVGQISNEAAKPLIKKGIVEHGVEETVKKTGKSAEELAEIVGRETPEGERLLNYAKVAGQPAADAQASVWTKLQNLSKYLGEGADPALRMTREEANEMVMQAIEQFGPKRVLEAAGGWKKLASALGDGTSAGNALESWRNGIFKDLEEYVTKELGGELQRTGSKGNFTNDMDISLLGPNASANREKALSFLATRAGSRPNWVSDLLYCDLFTDPRRIHLYDLLDAGIRADIAQQAAAMEKEIIFARRLHNAVQAGDQEMVELITKQRDALGVKAVKYQPYSAGDVAALYKQMDELHNQLKNATTESAKKEIALKIAQKQSIINTAEGGGYFTGGGVRKMVSEQEKLPGFAPNDLAARPFLAAQELGTSLDQLLKLDGEIVKLRGLIGDGAPDVAKLAAALKGIGKYGERFTANIPEAIRAGLGNSGTPSLFNQYAETFSELIAAARKGGADPTSLIKQIDSDSAALIAKTEQALRQFEQEQFEILQALQKAAKQEGVSGNLEKIQRLSLMQARWTQFKDGFVVHLKEAGRMLHNIRRDSNSDGAGDSSVDGDADGQ